LAENWIESATVDGFEMGARAVAIELGHRVSFVKSVKSVKSEERDRSTQIVERLGGGGL
tara:strand:- start:283 stop:459 length:177 start_codon:yes stop_codon:yes gene_type:complete